LDAMLKQNKTTDTQIELWYTYSDVLHEALNKSTKVQKFYKALDRLQVSNCV